MNKQQAYEALCAGLTVRNEYYSEEEWLRMNELGEIKTEEGYTMSIEDWEKYQDPDNTYEWSIVKGKENLRTFPEFSSFKSDLTATDIRVMHPADAHRMPKKLKRGRYISVEPRSDVQRNDPCICNSGLKYKKCCGK